MHTVWSPFSKGGDLYEIMYRGLHKIHYVVGSVKGAKLVVCNQSTLCRSLFPRGCFVLNNGNGTQIMEKRPHKIAKVSPIYCPFVVCNCHDYRGEIKS